MFEHLDDPIEFTPHDTFRRAALDRGRRRRSRRRLTTAASTVALAGVLAVVVLAAVPGTGDGGEIRTGPSDEQREPRLATGDAPIELPADELVRESHGLTATPAAGLREGDEVHLALDPPTVEDSSMAFVCAAEILGHRDDWLAAMDWCNDPVVIGGAAEATVIVERKVRAAAGLVDCAAAPGRCVFAVADGGRVAGLQYAPLAMAGDLGRATQEVRVYGAEGPLQDGDDIHVEAEGFAPGAVVRIALCTPVACDASMRGVSTPADRDGRLELDFRVFHEIQHLVEEGAGPHEIRWIACTDCRLEVGDGVDRLSLPLEIEPPDDPSRPRITVEGIDGPLAPGSTVRVTGEGFQPGVAAGMHVAWCPSDMGHLEVGVTDDEIVTCDAPPEGRPRSGTEDVDGPTQPTVVLNERGYVVDDDGSFVIEEFPLPGEDVTLGRLRCAARPGNCTIGWGQAGLLAFVRMPPDQFLPLDLSG